jgi:type IV pilus assembly protein PilX
MTNPIANHTTSQPHQSGISLVIVLIFLAILSILGVTGMQNATFASRIAGNEADRTLAFQAAEAALRDAENDIKSLTFEGDNCSTNCRADPIYRGNGFGYDCSLGRCIKTVGGAPVWESSAVWDDYNNDDASAKSVMYGRYTQTTVRPTLPVVSRQPRYILEYFNQGDYAVYRITAIGFGASNSTRAMLQAAVKVKPI